VVPSDKYKTKTLGTPLKDSTKSILPAVPVKKPRKFTTLSDYYTNAAGCSFGTLLNRTPEKMTLDGAEYDLG
jgi:hypothetical protein